MKNKASYQTYVFLTKFLNHERPHTLFQTFFFLKAYQNLFQALQNKKEFLQLRRQQQLLTSIPKVTADVLSPIP